MFIVKKRAYHGKTAILDFLLSVCGRVQAQRVKGELVYHTRLHSKQGQSLSSAAHPDRRSAQLHMQKDRLSCDPN